MLRTAKQFFSEVKKCKRGLLEIDYGIKGIQYISN